MDDEQEAYIDFDNLSMNIGQDNDDDELFEIEQPVASETVAVDLNPQEEEHLSQKLSQLSASDKESSQSKDITNKKKRSVVTTSTIDIRKKMKPSEEEEADVSSDEDSDESDDLMPKYLLSTNAAFQQMMIRLLQQNASAINIENLRAIALLIHKLECIKLDMRLWVTYLHSGTGKLNLPEQQQQEQEQAATSIRHPTLLMWPKQVKTHMISQGCATSSNPNEIDDESCLNHVHTVLEKFQNQTISYETELKQSKEQLSTGWTSEMEEAITGFVEKNVRTFYGIEIDLKISSVEYAYRDRLIQLEYDQQNPNFYQKQVFNKIYPMKCDKEQSKLNVAMLKQHIAHNHLPESFDSIEMPTALELDEISDTSTRQRLLNQCEKILQRAKSDMMCVYIATAEAKLDQYRIKFNSQFDELRENQRQGPANKKLTEAMWDIIGRRFQLIDQHLIRIYKYKLRFFGKAPTVAN